jgi:hypothetical protein
MALTALARGTLTFYRRRPKPRVGGWRWQQRRQGVGSLSHPPQQPDHGARHAARAGEDVAAGTGPPTGPMASEGLFWEAAGVALAAARLFIAWHAGFLGAEQAMRLLGESVTTRGARTKFHPTDEASAARPAGGVRHAQRSQGEAGCHGYCPRARTARQRWRSS